MMTALDILRACRAADEEIAELLTRAEQRRSALTYISAPLPEPSGGGHGTPDPDRIGAMTAEADALKKRATLRRRRHRVEVTAACDLVRYLPQLESEILFEYYVEGSSTGAIAKKHGYSEGYIRQKKKSAEAKLEKLDAKAIRDVTPNWYRKEAPEPVK
jgi:DNA-directed RNA polymerase specialized sigma24 family protein